MLLNYVAAFLAPGRLPSCCTPSVFTNSLGQDMTRTALMHSAEARSCLLEVAPNTPRLHAVAMVEASHSTALQQLSLQALSTLMPGAFTAAPCIPALVFSSTCPFSHD